MTVIFIWFIGTLISMGIGAAILWKHENNKYGFYLTALAIVWPVWLFLYIISKMERKPRR